MKKLFLLTSLSLLAGLFVFFLITGCNPENVVNDVDAKNIPSDIECDINILTQNTMLIPFGLVAPSFRARSSFIADLLPGLPFEIIGLQEVFWDRAQNNILEKWYRSENLLFKEMYLPQVTEDIPDMKDAREITEMSLTENPWNIKVINAIPLNNDKTAKISFGPYHVIGPDTDDFNFFKQDSGLLILSRYPIIAASAFSFTDAAGSDRLANKGVVYARIKVGKNQDDYIHFFNTHLQSHNYPEARFNNLIELFEFVENIISADIKYSEPGSDVYINPVVIVGDLNVKADMPDGWLEKAGLIAPQDIGELPDDFNILQNRTEDYKLFTQLFEQFSYSINLMVEDLVADSSSSLDPFQLKDLWLEIYPDEPGFTWIGKDWKFDSSNPYGEDGNTVATGGGPPERIDYIFYYRGSGNLKITPASIALFSEQYDNPQISDHLGLQSCFFTGNEHGLHFR